MPMPKSDWHASSTTGTSTHECTELFRVFPHVNAQLRGDPVPHQPHGAVTPGYIMAWPMPLRLVHWFLAPVHQLYCLLTFAYLEDVRIAIGQANVHSDHIRDRITDMWTWYDGEHDEGTAARLLAQWSTSEWQTIGGRYLAGLAQRLWWCMSPFVRSAAEANLQAFECLLRKQRTAHDTRLLCIRVPECVPGNVVRSTDVTSGRCGLSVGMLLKRVDVIAPRTDELMFASTIFLRVTGSRGTTANTIALAQPRSISLDGRFLRRVAYAPDQLPVKVSVGSVAVSASTIWGWCGLFLPVQRMPPPQWFIWTPPTFRVHDDFTRPKLDGEYSPAAAVKFHRVCRAETVCHAILMEAGLAVDVLATLVWQYVGSGCGVLRTGGAWYRPFHDSLDTWHQLLNSR
jgi:hypothetical protein